MMEGDYDCMYSDAHEDVDYYEGRDDLDDDLFYDDYDGSDGADDYYEERDNVMNDDFNVRGNMVVESEDNDAFDQSHDESDDNMSEAYDGSGNEDENYGGSDDSTHDCSREVESDEGEGSLDQRNGASDDAVEILVMDDEEGVGNLDENQSEPSSGNQSEPSGGSEPDVFADAQNGNYDGDDDDDDDDYLPSDDYEDMADEYDGDDIWDGDFVGQVPWQGDDTWDDVVTMGDEWYDYYDGDEVWDEDVNDGRFELRYEEYGGDTIPGEQGAGEAPAVDNFMTRTTPLEAGSGMQDPAPACDRLGSEGANRSCPICLERLVAQEVGSPWNCKHYFCISCILEWVRRSNTCPVDRKTICKIAVRCHVGSPVTRVVSVVPISRVAEEA